MNRGGFGVSTFVMHCNRGRMEGDWCWIGWDTNNTRHVGKHGWIDAKYRYVGGDTCLSLHAIHHLSPGRSINNSGSPSNCPPMSIIGVLAYASAYSLSLSMLIAVCPIVSSSSICVVLHSIQSLSPSSHLFVVVHTLGRLFALCFVSCPYAGISVLAINRSTIDRARRGISSVNESVLLHSSFPPFLCFFVSFFTIPSVYIFFLSSNSFFRSTAPGIFFCEYVTSVSVCYSVLFFYPEHLFSYHMLY